MKIEQAIKWFEDDIRRLQAAPNINGCGMLPEWAEQIEIHTMALNALRVQQEVEKNEPLTLEELREMDGKPVWDNFLMEWCVIMMDLCHGKGAVKYFDGGFNRLSEKRFYRRKPKEGDRR